MDSKNSSIAYRNSDIEIIEINEVCNKYVVQKHSVIYTEAKYIRREI